MTAHYLEIKKKDGRTDRWTDMHTLNLERWMNGRVDKKQNQLVEAHESIRRCRHGHSDTHPIVWVDSEF